ncbi:MAG TPA: APC family permease [Chloroflexota bacterium]|nr:APC family permease [Chloroflexota bacterium]
MTDHKTEGTSEDTASSSARRRPDLEWNEVVPGQKPGDSLVRIARHRSSRRSGPGYVVVRPETTEPQHGAGSVLAQIKHVLIGAPLATAAMPHERLNKTRALAIFSSDALSSVAYATEEIMKVLVLAGLGALSLTLPISIVIALLITIIVTSYRQTIVAYPNGGGSYIVSSDNLGRIPGLVAAAALMIDYTLTVAVSIAAGVDAITSAFPELLDEKVLICVVAIVLLTIGNLRGIRESGTIFAVPTYVFILGMYVLIVYGIIRLLLGGMHYVPTVAPPVPSRTIGLVLLLTAFAQGCAAVTGVEAISNGVPAFKEPSPGNARATMVWMAIVLATLFLGVSILGTHLNIVPNSQETVISQITRVVAGRGAFYYLIQFSTALILLLAANTSFNGFPPLVSIMANDGYMPHQFSFRGDRLAYSNGIMVLALMAIVLIVIFRVSVDALIGLYAIGVFMAFTLSQSGMVVRWNRLRERGWRRNIVINATGAVFTAVVTFVIAFTKFHEGAWIVLILTPLLVGMCLLIKKHYHLLATQTAAETPLDPADVRLRVVVPIGSLNLPARQALAFARAVSGTVTGIHVTDDLDAAKGLQRDWGEKINGQSQLVIIESPYRSLVGPLLAYLDTVHENHPGDTIMVVLPEFVPSRWWEHLLHNQTALLLKAALLFRPGVIVANVPYHIQRDKPALPTNPDHQPAASE